MSLDESLAALARQAREAARKPRSFHGGQTYYSPGFYDFEGVSFTLHHAFVDHVDPSIRGHESTATVLAVISDPIDVDSTFIDAEQKLLQVESMFATDEEVQFYNVSVQNPLAVFGNLRIRSTHRSSRGGKDDENATVCNVT
jgi:hypothetical protein